MGRRKIEIQPITHERNRSVTFLKRKNGLFKKAYELGVLCSVDVAVIIFEERPGHHVKLYQYGSSDIHDIVQRHMRHDGEKDTRGPQDFSGNNNSKLDDIGDGDDDDGDDDDELPARNKRRHDGKLKPPTDMVTSNMDYTSPNHRSLSIPQPPPLSLHIGGQSAGGGSTLPISNDRSIGMRDTNKRSSRLSLHPGHSRSPSDPVDPGSGNYSYYSGQNSGSFNRPTQYGHHSQHHSHSQSGPPHHGSSTQYQPFFPVSSSHQSPPPSFIPLQSEFPRGPPSSRGGGSGFGLPPRSNSTSSSSYDPPGMYSNMMRNPPPSSSQTSGPGGGPGGGGDLFAAFLDADEQSRHQSHTQQGSGLVALEWPVHNSSGGGNSASSAPSVPSSSVSNNPSATSSSAHPEGPPNGNWLDFLSNNNPHSSNAPSGRDSISWERGGASGGDHRGEMSEMFSGERARAGSSASASSGVVMGISGSAKRPKGEDDASLGVNIPSPAGINGRGGEAPKDGTKDGG